MIYLASYEAGEAKANRERERWLGRQLLSFGLKREYGRTWEVIAQEGQKPYLSEAPDISFNISHTSGLVVCAISRRQVGVDVERMRPWKDSLARRVCSLEEYEFVMGGEGASAPHIEDSEEKDRQERFIRLWTLKESFVKATGQGLSFPLRQITFSWDQEGGIKGSIPGFHFYQSAVYGKYIISVCEGEF